MKFKILRSKFADGLKTVQNIVTSKGSLPILQNISIECSSGKLTFLSTDLDVSIKCDVDCETIENGATTLPAKLLFNAVLKFEEGDVEVRVDESDKGLIYCGKARIRLNGLPEKDFPKISESEEKGRFKVERAVLKEMFRKTAYAASQDDTRRTLKGVLMSFKNNKLTMVATDGRRLAMVEHEMEFSPDIEQDVVLPSKTVNELQRLLDGEGEVSILIQNSLICFEIGETKVYSKLIDDTYPNYTQVIPSECAEKIAIDRQLLINALERASVMTMDEAHSTRLAFEGNILSISSAASDKGDAKDEVPIKYAGEKIEIMFNPNYVMDALKAIDDDEVMFCLNNGHSPAVIRCDIPFLYVLMPLRIN